MEKHYNADMVREYVNKLDILIQDLNNMRNRKAMAEGLAILEEDNEINSAMYYLKKVYFEVYAECHRLSIEENASGNDYIAELFGENGGTK